MTAAPEWMKRKPPEPARPAPAPVAVDASLDFAAELLSHIPADCPYDEWRDVVFGIADKFGAAGYELARSWSASAPHRFNNKDFDTLWRSASRPWPGPKITFGTVEKMAEDAGADRKAIWRRHHGTAQFDPVEAQEAARAIRSVGGKPVEQGDAVAPASSSVYTGPCPFDMLMFADIETNIVKRWIVKGLAGANELIVPYGAPGSGKSVLISDMICHIGAGWTWLGRSVKQAAVLYVAAERAALVLRRLAAFRQHHKIDDLPVAVIRGYFDMAKAQKDTNRIIATARRLIEVTGLAEIVIVIDTKRQVITDENSADVPALVGNISRIQQDTGATVIVIDHTPFHSPKKPAGNGALLAAADVTAIVEKTGDVRTLEIVKANDGGEGESFAFSLQSVVIGTDPETGDVTTAPVVVPADAPEPGKKAAGHLTASEKIALDALEEAITDAGERTGGSHVPDNAMTVHVELWRDYAYRRGISDSDKPDARKKAFQRARKELIVKQRIACWNDRVWITRPSGQMAADLILKSVSGHGT